MSVKSHNKIAVVIPKSRNEASQNWKQLMAEMGIQPMKPRRIDSHLKLEKGKLKGNGEQKGLPNEQAGKSSFVNEGTSISGFPKYDNTGKIIGGMDSSTLDKRRTWCLAMDCEMVGIGPMKESALARVSIVNEAGCCLLDTFVKPKVKVTDYRTAVSGVRETDLANAESCDTVVRRVAEILKGRVVVGHALENDFRALFIRHPKNKIRDTSRYFKRGRGFTPGLKLLARKHLGIEIQKGEHNSILDAQVAMKLYLINRKGWEEQIREVRLQRTKT